MTVSFLFLLWPGQKATTWSETAFPEKINRPSFLFTKCQQRNDLVLALTQFGVAPLLGPIPARLDRSAKQGTRA
jgi:hypothetical protein